MCTSMKVARAERDDDQRRKQNDECTSTYRYLVSYDDT